MLIRRLCNIGNSWGIIIPKTILEMLGINPVRDQVVFEIEADGLKIKKYKKETN